MADRVETLRDIPNERINAVQEMYLRAGATVSRETQEDGNWTVVATFHKIPELEVEREEASDLGDGDGDGDCDAGE